MACHDPDDDPYPNETEQEHSERMHRKYVPCPDDDDDGPGWAAEYAFEDDYEPGVCGSCGGTGWQDAGDIAFECGDCGGDGYL